MALFLDSSVMVDLLRGADYGPALVAREPLLIAPITVHGVLRGSRGEDEDDRIFDLLAALEVVAIGQEEAELSARWRRGFAAKGVTLDMADTLIAACAFLRSLPLATGNVKDFPMPELRVEQWPPPPV